MRKYEVVSAEDIEKIHENTIRIMENIGVEMPYEPAKELLAANGATVEGNRVRFTRKMVEDAIESAPSSFTWYSRNPEKNLLVSTETTSYGGPNCPPFVTDLERGRRSGTLSDYIEIVKILEKLDNIDFTAHMSCEPQDIPVDERPLTMVMNALKYSEKPTMGSSIGYDNAMQCIELASIPFGGLDAIKTKPVIASIPCTLTPLSYADHDLGAIRAYAETGQVQFINSLSMAGMTTPTTLAGLISVQNAEVLAGIVYAQLVNPGCPVVYAAAGSNAEMSNGVLCIGSPECALVSLVNGQLAKRYQIPCRISGALSDSKMLDSQAAFESTVELASSLMAGGNIILHAAGIIETYNCISFEKLIVDNEIVGYMKRMNRGVEVNEDTLAYDVIEEEGPQGNFLTCDHTLEFFRDEFYHPTICDRQVYGQWETNGALSMEKRATARWKQILADYGESTLDADAQAKMEAYMESCFAKMK